MTYNPPSIDDYIDKITDYIEYYPNVVDPKLCNTITKHFDKNAKWETSTFSTHDKNSGTSKVNMQEYWITKKKKL